MRSGLKAAVVLLVTLPVLTYVGGRLAAAPPDPGPRTPVILDRSPSRLPSPPAEQDDGDVQVVNPAPTRVGEDDGGTGDDGSDDDGRGPEDDDRTDDDTTDGDD
jgi:hypothetical protein